ncbi:MAG: hypothetical protein M3Y05_02165 [Gemmatimonadota bacterium]|nr:hypothetical protein [Gemmatimonadota bacterium]
MKTVMDSSDVETGDILRFHPVRNARVLWVTDEAKCRKAVATLDAQWPDPHGGPVYLLQIGSEYAAVQGDPRSIANFAIVHLGEYFEILGNPIVWQ